ncbi:hypothetical protein [Kosakonia sp. WA-90]|uniref:hypothetical protein n=1 Tax=Kosakonia sp. WA-90 TaxID=3153576 RepID=UPI00325D0E4D
MTMEVHERRPVRAHYTRWAAAAARYLRQKGCTPDTISLFSIVLALLSCLGFLAVWRVENITLQRGLLLFACLAAPIFFHVVRYYFT